MAPASYISCNYEKMQRVYKNKPGSDLLISGDYSTSADFKLHQHHAIGVVEETYCRRRILSYETSENQRSQEVPQLIEQFGTIVLDEIKKPVESWDEDFGTYDPWQNTETRDVIRRLVCVPKEVKKAFKQRERIRFQNIIKVRQNRGNHYMDTLTFVERMRKLSLHDIDTLIDSVDFSKLHLGNSDGSSNTKGSNNVEQVLIQKLKALLVGCLND